MDRENYGYLVYRLNLGMVEVSVPPEAPFFQVPATLGKDSEGEYVFGEEALSRETDLLEIQTLTGVSPWTDRFMYYAFFSFMSRVFRRPDVLERLEDLNVLVVFELDDNQRFRGFMPPLVLLKLIPRYVRESREFMFVTPCELASYTMSEDLRGSRVCLNMESDFLVIYRFQRLHRSAKEDYVMIGFEHIANFFLKLLCEKGYSLTSEEGQVICRELAKKYCYVALDVDEEIKRVESLGGVLHEVTLANGLEIELGTECFMAPEVMFNPGLIGFDEDQCLVNVYVDMLTSTQGNQENSIHCRFAGSFLSSLTGFKERLQHEAELFDPTVKDRDCQLLDATLSESVLGYGNVHRIGQL